jgi:hypothetical protein
MSKAETLGEWTTDTARRSWTFVPLSPGHIYISLLYNHAANPHGFTVQCYQLGLDRPLYGLTSLEDAKRRALVLARDIFKQYAASLDSILGAPDDAGVSLLSKNAPPSSHADPWQSVEDYGSRPA